MTEKTLNIYQRLNRVMKEVDYIQKEAKKNGMQYAFVAHDKVTGALHESLVEHGIFIKHHVMGYHLDGNKHIVQVQFDFINIDEPTDKMTVEGWGSSVSNDDKGYGKALTYACKNTYLKNFMLEAGEEADIDSEKNQVPVQHIPEKAKTSKNVESIGKPRLEKQQLDSLRIMLQAQPQLREEVLKFTKKQLISDIEADRYEDVVKFIEMKTVKEGAA